MSKNVILFGVFFGFDQSPSDCVKQLGHLASVWWEKHGSGQQVVVSHNIEANLYILLFEVTTQKVLQKLSRLLQVVEASSALCKFFVAVGVAA